MAAVQSNNRDRVLNLRLSADELDRAHALAFEDGLPVSQLVRLLLTRAYRERFGVRKSPATSRKAKRA